MSFAPKRRILIAAISLSAFAWGLSNFTSCLPAFALEGKACPAAFNNPVAAASGKFVKDNVVEVVSDRQKGSFLRTNRGLESIIGEGGPIARKVLLSPELSGGKVLDAGTGDGALTLDLRARDVDATGLDIVLRPNQKALPFFVEKDIRNTGFKAETFDLAVSAFNVFYYVNFDKSFRDEALSELSRVTKPGGRILLIAQTGYTKLNNQELPAYAGVQARDELNRLIKARPELELVEVASEGEGQTVLLRKKN